MKDNRNSCLHDKNEDLITEEISTFANEDAAVAFDKFGDIEKGIISIVNLELLLDEIEKDFHCDEFDTQVSIVNHNSTGCMEWYLLLLWHHKFINGDNDRQP